MTDLTTSAPNEGETKNSSPKRYPTAVDLLAIIGVFFVAHIVATFVTRFCGYTFDPTALNNNIDTIRESAQIEAGKFSLISYTISMSITCIAAFILGKVRGNKAPVARFSLAGFNPTLLLWSMLMLICVAIVIDPLTHLLPSAPVVHGRGWAMVVLLVIVAPIFEELLCRGMILEAVRAKSRGWIAVCVSSLFFAVMHLHPTSSLNALIVGAILAYIYIRSSSLFAPIILHSFNNALAYMLIWGGVAELSLSDIIHSSTIYYTLYGCAVVALAVSLFNIIRELRTKSSLNFF